MVESIGVTALILVLIILLIERSHKIYQLNKIIEAQSAQILANKRKREDFAMLMSEAKNPGNDGLDPLTQLPNKATFEKQLDNLIEQSHRFNNLFALLILDLRGFKKINESESNEVGDRILIEVARRLKDTLRGADFLSRYEADKFMVLFPNMIKPELIVHAVGRMIQKIKEPIEIDGKKITVDTNAGIAIFPYDGGDKTSLLTNVNTALTKAKTLGKNIFEFYQAEIQALGEREINLKSAIQSPDFLKHVSLEYQPYYNIKNHEMFCIEVRAVLNDPELGKVPFNEFVRVAHYSSKMFELYEWMMKSAIQKFDNLADFTTKPRRFIFTFNLKQFEIPKFLENIITIIEKLNSSENEIIMEITDDDIASAQIEEFKADVLKLNQSNIQVAIGILLLGRFAMNNIDRVSFSYLKIDEKLVRDLSKRRESLLILEKIMELVSNLNIGTLTAGVDTEQQKQILENLGCTTMQGKVLRKKTSEGFFISS